MSKERFIETYVATFLAGLYVKRSDEYADGNYPYSTVEEIPIEDAIFMANIAWTAYEKHIEPLEETGDEALRAKIKEFTSDGILDGDY